MWHPRILIQVPAVLLLIQLAATAFEQYNMMAQVPGFLLPGWKMKTKFQTPGFGLALISIVLTIWGVNQWTESIYLFLSLCHSDFQISKNLNQQQKPWDYTPICSICTFLITPKDYHLLLRWSNNGALNFLEYPLAIVIPLKPTQGALQNRLAKVRVTLIGSSVSAMWFSHQSHGFWRIYLQVVI